MIKFRLIKDGRVDGYLTLNKDSWKIESGDPDLQSFEKRIRKEGILILLPGKSTEDKVVDDGIIVKEFDEAHYGPLENKLWEEGWEVERVRK